jgi:hypothetical protein
LEKRVIELTLAAIEKKGFEPLEQLDQLFYEAGDFSAVLIANQSNYPLQVLCNGDSSFRFTLDASSMATRHLKNGEYMIALTSGGTPDALLGRQRFRGGTYSYQFEASTAENSSSR